MEMTSDAQDLTRRLGIFDMIRYNIDRKYSRLAYRWFGDNSSKE